ncbi:DUF1330 domain-containing protein [Paenibacillus sp. NPDC058174]|uniref:DUF1330 domain-containing protein n=1 Tax=Paenibacillus sp. NPDC058174 TaxID=3346366 RepID=UPI0036DDAF7E
MSAYIVFVRDKINDPEELDIYAKLAPPSLAGHPVKPLAAYGTHEVIEGPPIEGAAILEFPSFEEARAFYYSPSYQEAVKHRLKGAAYRSFIIEGVSK